MNTFNLIFLIVALALIISILLQQRGSGLGEAFGGTGGVYASRRGAERALYNLTILISILFILLGGISLYQRRVQVPQPSAATAAPADDTATSADNTVTSENQADINSPQ